MTDFFLFLSWDRFITSSHSVHLLCCAVKLDGITSFFVAFGVGFLFMWPLHSVLVGVILEYFTLFRIVPVSMQQEYFPSVRPIARMACISCIALVSAACLGVVRRGGFSSLSFPAITGTVGVYPKWIFRIFSAFVDFPCDFRSFE